MKNFAVNASYFYKDSLSNSLKRLAKVGFCKIEFSGTSLKDISPSAFQELLKIIDGEGLECAAINAVGDLIPVNLGNLIALQRRERSNAVDHLKRCIEFSASLKSSRMVIDIGTSTEDLLPLDKQNEIFFSSCSKILTYAKPHNVAIVLMNVPGRRWFPWDGLPPDKSRVVERHIWPWRAWPDNEKIVKKIQAKLKGQIFWTFDTANELVARGVERFQLKDAVAFYLENNLDIIYLANHPGPYNLVWHRLLLHQPLWDGFYQARDYQAALELTRKKKYQGEIVLQIREKEPSEESLRRSLQVLEKTRK